MNFLPPQFKTMAALQLFCNSNCNRFMDIACAPDILTMNMTHTGELGYVFYIPNEFAIHVYDSIMEEGQKFGLKHCGYYAQRAVRIEKFYAYWGQVRYFPLL